MPMFLITPDTPRVPAVRVVATDHFDLGEKVAAHLCRHKHLLRSVNYDAQIGDEVGQIFQAGMRRPITFTITKES